MKRYFTYGVLLLIVVGLFYYWRPIPVDRTYQGWLYTYDGAVDEAVEIRLQGTLHRSFFSHHRYEGKVIVKGVSIGVIPSYPGSLAMQWLSVRERWGEQGSHNYLGIIDSNNLIRTLGGFRLANDLSAISGWLQNVEGIYPEQNPYFSAPATNAEESKPLNKRLSFRK